MHNKNDMLRGAELMTQAFFDSATSKHGMSFGAVVDRFCQLAGIDRFGFSVLSVLHHAGGQTVNNAIGDDYRSRDCDQPGVCLNGQHVSESPN